MNDWPRVLVVCHEHLGISSNLGQTLGSLFDGWPRERVRLLYGSLTGREGADSDGNWRLTLRTVQGYGRLRSLIVRAGIAGAASSRGLPAAIGPSREDTSVVRQAAAIARAWAELLPYEISPGLRKWLATPRPDLIFSTLGSLRWTRLVEDVSKDLQVPVVPFFCDDWPESSYRFSPLVAAPRRALLARLEAVLKRAPHVLCISDAMASEYARRYALPVSAFMRCVPANEEPPESPHPVGDTLRLLYVGGLHLRRWRVLEMLGEALNILRSDGVPASLTIYAPESDLRTWKGRLDRRGVVEVKGTLPADAIPVTLSTAHILVHVESFDEELAQFTRLSLSTKLPDYLAAARPILCIGPRGVSSIEYVRGCAAGLVIDRESVDEIVAALRRLATEPELRESLGRAGWRTVRARHDSTREREKFRLLLRRVPTTPVPRVDLNLRSARAATTAASAE